VIALKILAEVQNEILNNNTVLIIDADVLLPRIGGYNARPYSSELQLYELPRASELKALWRWWLRVILSSIFEGQKTYDELDEKISELLGSTRQQSMFTITIDTTKAEQALMRAKDKIELFKQVIDRFAPKYDSDKRGFSFKEFKELLASKKDREVVQLYNEIVRLNNIPRIKLLEQRRRDEDIKKYLRRMLEDIAFIATIPTSLPIRIIIGINEYVKLDDEELKSKLELALASLLLSLLIGGIGSITRRGFGSIVLKNVGLKPKYEGLAKEIVERIDRILQVENEDKLREEIIEYIKFVCELADRVYKKGTSHTSQKMLIPKVPTLSPNTDYFKLEVFECNKHGNIINILESIGKATLKAEWKRICNVNVRKSGGEFHTWILGLPRSTKETGYFVNGDKGRRPSAIAFKVFENKNGKRFVIVYGFLSRDWPINRLVHKGEHHYEGREVTQLKIVRPARQSGQCILSSRGDEEFLRQVFEAAFNFVTKIIEKECKGGTS